METSDKEIAAEIAARPEKGFRLLFGKYGEPVYWHIRRLVVSHADAQDAAQETFVRVFRFFGNFHGLSLRSWIYRIATNEAMRVLSARKDGQCSMEDSGASAFFADEYVDYGNAGAVKLQRAILSLPRKQQLAFTLRYYDEMTFAEIAKVTDSTAVNAKANYHIAKNRIIRYMKTHD